MDPRQTYSILAKSLRGKIRVDEPMERHTSYKIGGPADLFVEPAGTEDLTTLVRFLREYGVSGLFLGAGSNLLVSDQGIRGVVVKMTHCCKEIRLDGHSVRVGAGVSLERLLSRTEREGVGGIEFLSGIPGTLGGAMKMNAGAWGGELGNRVTEIEVMDPEGKVRRLNRGEVMFGYRSVKGLEGYVILGANLLLEYRDAESISKERNRLRNLRRETQPLGLPSCGSVFKRPGGTAFPGELIEEAGCKGLRAGRAEVSTKHANFIVNLGGATAQEVWTLIREVRHRVQDRFGIELCLEVKPVGEFGSGVNDNR